MQRSGGEAGGASTRIRVAVVDGYALVGHALARALSGLAGFEVVGVSTSVPAAFAACGGVPPDVLLAEVQLDAGPDPPEILRHPLVTSGHVRVIMLAPQHLASYAPLAQAEGAAGLLLKTSTFDELVTAIRTVHAGGSCFAPVPPAGWRSRPRPTRREQEVLEALTTGASNAEIGRALAISTRTVESHMRRLFTRYRVESRSKLLILAWQEGWIRLDQPT